MGIGIGLAIWEKPVISRLVSIEAFLRNQAGNGLRAGDLLAVDGFIGALRAIEERDRGDRNRPRSDHPLSGPSSCWWLGRRYHIVRTSAADYTRINRGRAQPTGDRNGGGERATRNRGGRVDFDGS